MVNNALKTVSLGDVNTAATLTFDVWIHVITKGTIESLTKDWMTLAHETGHWLGLFRTFQGNDCSGSGDFVSDTPAEAYSGIDGPDGGPCTIGRDTCLSLPGLDVSTFSFGLFLCLHPK